MAPKNYGYKYRGEIPLYTALMVSSNVCAARLIEYVGIRPVIQLARVMGITTPLEYDYTIALGSNGVKLFEITRAYGVFSNGGYKVEPYSVESIETSRGKVIYTAPQMKASKVMAMETAAAMTAMLKTVIQSGTGAAANIGKPAAAKTGTTDDSKDATFFGYTPNIVTGVWVGNDDNTKMGNLTGGTVPALIWKDVMKVATEPYGSKDFDYPPVELKPFKLKQAPVVITPESAQKTFDNEDAIPAEQTTETNNNDDFENFAEESATPAKKRLFKNKDKEENKSQQKVEVKAVKIDAPKTSNEQESKLAPIPN